MPFEPQHCTQDYVRAVSLRDLPVYLQGPWQQEVVAIQKHQKIPFCDRNPNISSAARAHIVFHFDEADHVPIFLKDALRPIPRSIIDYNYFFARVTLRKSGVDRIADECGLIVGRDDDTEN